MKNKKNKFFFQVTKRVFFLFFGPLLLSNLITFLFFIHFKQFKVIQERELKFYKSYWYFNSKETNIKGSFWVSKNRPLQCSMVFFEFLTPFTLGDHNFLISNPFSRFLLCQMRQEEGFKFCLDTRINKTLPWLLYSNTLVASDVQLSWFMKFAMEFFIPYPLASNSIWLSI